MQAIQVRYLGWENLLEENMATPSSILAWRIPWTEEPGGLQSMGLQRVIHSLSDWAHSTEIPLGFREGPSGWWRLGSLGRWWNFFQGSTFIFFQFSSKNSGQFQQSGRAASSQIHLLGLDLKPKCLWNINQGHCHAFSWHGFWYWLSLWEFTLFLCI